MDAKMDETIERFSLLPSTQVTAPGKFEIILIWLA
jgi:hypothetical protein